MIDKAGRVRLVDFSLLALIPDRSTFLSTCIGGGTAPWMSPELLDPRGFGLEESRPTGESDCYALAMAIYEVLSGQPPFAPTKFPILQITRGDRPERPRGEQGRLFTDGIWELLQRCWKHQPGERINAKAVLQGLEGEQYLSRSPSDLDVDVEIDSGYQLDITANDPSIFSLPRRRLTFNHSRGITAPLTTYGDAKLLVSPLGSSPRVPGSVVPGQFPDSPQAGNRDEGRIGDWLARVGWRIFSVAIRGLYLVF